MSLANEVTRKQTNQDVVKVAMFGDAGTGKTSLMVKYVENKFDVAYIQTLGLNFMEKVINLKTGEVTLSIWDTGGAQDFGGLMSLVLDETKAALFAFELTHKSSLHSVRRWYKDARKLNKAFIPFLIGTKYDLFAKQPQAYKKEITKEARKYAAKMNAPLIYCSSIEAINIQKIFQIIIAKVLQVKSKVQESHDELSEPIVEYMLQQNKSNVSSDEGEDESNNNDDSNNPNSNNNNNNNEDAKESGTKSKDSKKDKGSKKKKDRHKKSRRDKRMGDKYPNNTETETETETENDKEKDKDKEKGKRKEREREKEKEKEEKEKEAMINTSLKNT